MKTCNLQSYISYLCELLHNLWVYLILDWSSWKHVWYCEWFQVTKLNWPLVVFKLSVLAKLLSSSTFQEGRRWSQVLCWWGGCICNEKKSRCSCRNCQERRWSKKTKIKAISCWTENWTVIMCYSLYWWNCVTMYYCGVCGLVKMRGWTECS